MGCCLPAIFTFSHLYIVTLIHYICIGKRSNEGNGTVPFFY